MADSMENYSLDLGSERVKITDWLVLLASYWLLLTVLLLMYDYDPHEIIHFIAVVANSWLETLLTSIDFLPKDVIKREVDAYLLIKSLSPLIILWYF